MACLDAACVSGQGVCVYHAWSIIFYTTESIGKATSSNNII